MGMEWGATLVRSISLDFLGVGPFCREGHPHEVWISLDSLARIETFQWVTRLKALKFFSLAFPGVERRRNGKLGVEAMRKRTIIHRVSLT